MQGPRWIDDCIVKYSARLYHKFDNTRVSDYARSGSVELDAKETWEEHARGTNHA